MKNLIRWEELGLFGFSIFMFAETDFAWWWYLVLILVPDFSMIGYAAGARVGGVLYNVAHHRGLAVLLWTLGIYLHHDWLTLWGIVLFGHSSMDRIFGYGLKYPDSFHHTHLGWIKPPLEDTSTTLK